MSEKPMPDRLIEAILSAERPKTPRKVSFAKPQVYFRSISFQSPFYRPERVDSDTTISKTSRRRHSTPPGPIPQGIYWPSPMMMIGLFCIGIVISAVHHVYYSFLDRRRVGDDQEQQRAIRFGSTFAHMVQTTLVASVGYSFTQTLWKTLRKKSVSIRALDAAFGADRSPWALCNREMLRKLRIVSVLGLISQCMPLPSLITPATLFVMPNVQYSWTVELVPTVNMFGSQWSQFAYSVNDTATSPLLFLGPRTIISRLTTATAAQGAILDIVAPSPNSSYSLHFYGPVVRCQDANLSTAIIIDTLRDEFVSNYTGNTIEYSNNYFAFVPDFSNLANKTSASGVQIVAQTRLQMPSNASNELWMVFSRYAWDSTGNSSIVDHYTTCKLYNASYSVCLSFMNGMQSMNLTNITMLNTVDYPSNNDSITAAVQQQHAYSAVFWAMSDLIVGSMGMFRQYLDDGISTTFPEITTELERTSLLGSSDLDVFFDGTTPLDGNQSSSDQRQADIALAKNRTLAALIEELSSNITISFLSSDLLSPPAQTNITHTTQINLYAYHSRNLLFAYSFAITFALLAILIGAYSYYQNGYSHSKNFSAILAATRDQDLAELFFADIMGRLPLHADVERAQLRFGSMVGGGLGFREEPPRRSVSVGSVGVGVEHEVA
ncbi:uncharacterized protein LY89DRAFT_733266 [Mollisia scopiformis]|uniref:Uncharacterized protein n=1 Tax=Mollisia scopiformis TaxID=149040 RepID=A0A194XB64_MOLSC|nr:uncharacterized protein LY89DRAFT_733266 [Mollisia scopiformis]KUJ17415.1 hypothetical protein LY89DRAFT_733266 [Mollisia scopiformis]